MRLITSVFFVAHAETHHVGWTWEPVVTTLLAATALLYVAGLIRLWSNAGRWKGIRAWQVLAFAGGWTALVIALVSPLDA
ncbi:MAG TPA: hypothetical protein VH087_15375, partial [Thermoanaerobaculia bacterium]|nr:hypothetical protein [Thermoanaerobaculia bacterium]